MNISIPDDLAPLVSKWRRKINLSEICAQALRYELTAVESHRSAATVVSKIRRRTNDLEDQIIDQYGVVDALVAPSTADNDRDIRVLLGQKAAEYLNQRLSTGSVLALAGGRQSWCIVENLGPRPLEISVVALGYQQNDPIVLHAHPNTLATLLWLLFGPRATARLIGSDPAEVFDQAQPIQALPKYFIVGSCGNFGIGSPLARLLGDESTAQLVASGASADFLYTFFDRTGEIVSPSINCDQSIISSDRLSSLSKRQDTRILLVAGGHEKIDAMRFTLEAKLCNVLVTDADTAKRLLGRSTRSQRSHVPR